MALGSTEPLSEMSIRNLPGGGKGRPAHKADNLIAICEPIVFKTWEPRRLTTLWAFMACYKDSFTFLFIKLLSDRGKTCILIEMLEVERHLQDIGVDGTLILNINRALEC
jgi:hypothetical protein